MPRLKEYIVPCRVTYTADVFIKAKDEEAALAKFDEGDFDAPTLNELTDWTKDGKIQING
jgi:hypothetical protein